MGAAVGIAPPVARVPPTPIASASKASQRSNLRVDGILTAHRERRIIQTARRHSDLFPLGTLEMVDGRDGRIASAALGIEVSELLSEKPEGASSSPPQLSTFQSELYAKEHLGW